MSRGELFGGAGNMGRYREGPIDSEGSEDADPDKSGESSEEEKPSSRRLITGDEFRSRAVTSRPRPTPPKKGLRSKKDREAFEKLVKEWERENQTSIMQSGQFPRAMNLMVTNHKGGAAKTTTVHCVSAALADGRGDGAVAAFDGSESKGTILSRVEHQPGRGLVDLMKSSGKVDSLPKLTSFGSRQSSGAVIFGSPKTRRQFSGTDVEAIGDELGRYFSIIITDSANNPDHPAFIQAIKTTDAVVIPTVISWDSGIAALEALSLFLERSPEGQCPYRPELADRTIVVITHDGRPEPEGAANAIREVLEGARVMIVEVPFDPHLAEGTVFTWSKLSEESKQAWREVAVAVTNALQIAADKEEY